MACRTLYVPPRQIDEFDDRVIFGEIYAPLADLMEYYGGALGSFEGSWTLDPATLHPTAESPRTLVRVYRV